MLRRLIVNAHDELARIPGPQADAFRAKCAELGRTDVTEIAQTADGRVDLADLAEAQALRASLGKARFRASEIDTFKRGGRA